MKLHIQLQPDGATATQQFEIPFHDGTVVIGRGPDSPVPLEGSKLSRNHVAFGLANGVLTLTDLSSNGVWLNAQSVPKKSAVPLNGSEEIAIPGYRLRVRLLSPPPQPIGTPQPAPHAAPPEAPGPAPRKQEPPSTPAPGSPDVHRSTVEMVPASLAAPDEAAEAVLPAWWRLSAAERLVLIFVGLSIALIVYYYSLQ